MVEINTHANSEGATEPPFEGNFSLRQGRHSHYLVLFTQEPGEIAEPTQKERNAYEGSPPASSPIGGALHRAHAPVIKARRPSAR